MTMQNIGPTAPILYRRNRHTIVEVATGNKTHHTNKWANGDVTPSINKAKKASRQLQAVHGLGSVRRVS